MEPEYGFTAAPRDEGFKKRKFRLMDCTFLTSAVIVILVCGLWILFHTAIRGVRHPRSPRDDAEFVFSLVSGKERFVSTPCREVCTTKDCLKTAAGMISRLETRTDVCDDFYGFSCGKYQKVSMDEVQQRNQFMTDVSEEVLLVVVDLIENIPRDLPRDMPGYSASKAKRFYESCKDFRSTEDMALPSAIKHLEKLKIRNWPYLNPGFVFSSADLDRVLIWMSLYDANPIFSLEIVENGEEVPETAAKDSGNTSVGFNIKVKIAGRSLLLTNLFERKKLVAGMKTILEHFGMSDEAINSTIEDSLTLERQLQDVKQISRKRIANCSSNTSLSCSAYEFDCSREMRSEMQKWCAVVLKVMEDIGMREKYSNLHIILQDKFYFEDVRNLLNHVSHRSIAHGLALEFFLENGVTMNYYFRKTSVLQLYPKDLMKKLIEQRTLFCGLWVLNHVPALVEIVFYSTKYRGELEKEGNDIYNDIQDSIVAIVRNMTWMDTETRQSFEQLMQSVNVSIHRHVKYVSNAMEVDELYDKVSLTEESFLSNVMELKRFRMTLKFLYHDSIATSSRQRNHFHLNPRYLWEMIYVDFASFIFPLISTDRPRYVNLGNWGYVVSHEYGHGVEIFLRDPKNMSSSFENALNEKKKCLVDQYSEYEIDLIGKMVNGSFTLNENMADFFALRAVYQAMKQHQEKCGTEKGLPGLPFSTEQLFFISTAQFLCETNTLTSQEAYLKDPHSPNKWRVRGAMKNFRPFSDAFNCPEGSRMNPLEKCSF